MEKYLIVILFSFFLIPEVSFGCDGEVVSRTGPGGVRINECIKKVTNCNGRVAQNGACIEEEPSRVLDDDSDEEPKCGPGLVEDEYGDCDVPAAKEPTGSQCQADYDRAFKACEQAFDGGPSNSEITGLMQGAAQMKSQVEAMLSQGNIAKACKKNAAIQGVLTAVSGVYAASCGLAKSNCLRSCGIEQLDDPSFKKLTLECGSFQQKIDQAVAQGAQNLLTTAAAAACGKSAGLQNQASAVAPDFCASNPDSPACEEACSTAASKGRPECICSDPEQQRTNPICNPNSGKTVNTGFGTTGTANREGLLSAGELNDFFPDEQDFEGEVASGGGDVAGGQGGSGGSGGGPSSSGGLGGDLGDGSGQAGAGPYDTDVIKGTSNSKGGGFSYGSNRSNGNGNGYGRSGKNGIKGVAGKGNGKFDLSKYLPKNRKAQRALAGMSIKAKDGITGPMGPSIWEKVSRRYKRVRPYLKP